MIPIRDNVPAKSPPVAMWWIIFANVAVFLVQANLNEDQLEWMFMNLGVVPSNFAPLQPLAILSLFTNMFMHGGWGHLLGNMWTLYLFGDNVEDRMGSGRFTVFYVLCGLLASLTHLMTNLGSDIPAVGASGAISAVMGAYLLMYPKANIAVMVPILMWPFVFNLKAWIYLGGWFVLQYISGTTDAGDGAGVAFWAHIGGFVAGMLLFSLFLKPRPQREHVYRDEFAIDQVWTG